jgi:hypothetical protein
VDKVALGEVFSPSTSVFPCKFHSTGAPLLGKGQKITIIVTFIVGLHNKPHGCGASVASAAGPFINKKKKIFPTPNPSAEARTFAFHIHLLDRSVCEMASNCTHSEMLRNAEFSYLLSEIVLSNGRVVPVP